MGFSRTKHSGTETYPTPEHVVQSLLESLVKEQRGWAHFEWREHQGWLKNAFRKIPPFVEVCYEGDSQFELNLGLPSSVKDSVSHCTSKGMSVPDSWDNAKHGMMIQVDEIETLTQWILEYFVKVYECPEEFHLNGWLDGL